MSSQSESNRSHSSGDAGREHGALEKRLRSRMRELREDVCAGLIAEDEERYLDLVGNVREWANEHVAVRLRELDLRPVHRHLPEIEAIDAALQRIEAGRYGLCVECGATMACDFLAANPTAARCPDCVVSA
ncbi:MAG: TraR/DksA family transcriptional regulator [Gammaproteobacteria bacterium]